MRETLFDYSHLFDGAYARIDVFDGHTFAQYLPGERHRLICDLLTLVDALRNKPPVSAVTAAELNK